MKETIITYYIKDGKLISRISQNLYSSSTKNESKEFERLVPRISKPLVEKIIEAEKLSS